MKKELKPLLKCPDCNGTGIVDIYSDCQTCGTAGCMTEERYKKLMDKKKEEVPCPKPEISGLKQR